MPTPFPKDVLVAALAVRPDPPLYVAIADKGQVARSVDGRTWEAGPALTFQGSGDADLVSDVAYSHGRFVAIGEEGSSAGSGVDLVAYVPMDVVAWTSIDGIQWQARRLALTIDGAPARLSGLLPVADGFLAIAHGFEGGPSAIAHSTDGLAWTTTPFVSDDAGAVPMDLAGGSSGPYIAVGEVGTNRCRGAGDPAAWWSPDGVTWQLATGDLGCGLAIEAAGSRAGDLVVVSGNDPSGNPTFALALSTDGRSWTQVPTPAGMPVVPVGVTPGGVLVAGGLASVDGRTWWPTGIKPGFVRRAFAGSVLMACGSAGCEEWLLQR